MKPTLLLPARASSPGPAPLAPLPHGWVRTASDLARQGGRLHRQSRTSEGPSSVLVDASGPLLGVLDLACETRPLSDLHAHLLAEGHDDEDADAFLHELCALGLLVRSEPVVALHGPPPPGQDPDAGPLAWALLEQLRPALGALARLAPKDQSLEAIRDRLLTRLDDAEIPLLTALDADEGPLAGLLPALEREAMMLDCLATHRAPPSPDLHARLLAACPVGAPLDLGASPELTQASLPPLPDGMDLDFSVYAERMEDLERGRARIVLHRAAPALTLADGAALLADPAALALARAHMAEEERLRPGILLADLLWSPAQGPSAPRPALRGVEIPWGAVSDHPSATRIPASDLSLGLALGTNRLLLRQISTGLELRPRPLGPPASPADGLLPWLLGLLPGEEGARTLDLRGLGLPALRLGSVWLDTGAPIPEERPFLGRFTLTVLTREEPRAPRRRAPPPAPLPRPQLALRWTVGPGAADAALTEDLAPLLDEATARGRIEGWHFLRSRDPRGPLLRVGLIGEGASALLPELFGLAERAGARCGGLLAEHALPEHRRYGGAEGYTLAERIFALDSQLALALLRALPEHPDPETLRAGFALEALSGILARAWPDPTGRRAAVALRLPTLLSGEGLDASALARGAEARLQTRATLQALPELQSALRETLDRMVDPLARLRRMEGEGRLDRPADEVLWRFVHLHPHRLFRVRQARAEGVLLDLIARSGALDGDLRHDGPDAGRALAR